MSSVSSATPEKYAVIPHCRVPTTSADWEPLGQVRLAGLPGRDLQKLPPGKDQVHVSLLSLSVPSCVIACGARG